MCLLFTLRRGRTWCWHGRLPGVLHALAWYRVEPQLNQHSSLPEMGQTPSLSSIKCHIISQSLLCGACCILVGNDEPRCQISTLHSHNNPDWTSIMDFCLWAFHTYVFSFCSILTPSDICTLYSLDPMCPGWNTKHVACQLHLHPSVHM